MPTESDQLTLADLPPDLIKMIIRMEESSLESMPLISQSWNICVVEYLNEPRNKLPLERVHLRGSIHDEYQQVAIAPSASATMRYHRQHVCMHAIMPDRCKHRVGFGRWLRVHLFPFPNGAIEVKCNPIKFTDDGNSEEQELSEPEAKRRRKNVETRGSTAPCHRFWRFFSRFSHIETLLLEEIINQNVFDAVTKSLGDTTVIKLDVRGLVCCRSIQLKIVELVRRHRVKHVFIHDFYIALDCLRDSVREITNAGATLDIYGRGRGRPSSTCLDRLANYWENERDELKSEGISLELKSFNTSSRMFMYWETPDLSFMTADMRKRGTEYLKYQIDYVFR